VVSAEQAVRPRPREPGPARDLHRRRLPRQRRPVSRGDGNSAAWRPRLSGGS